MAQQQPTSQGESIPAVQLADGGLSADTEVMTTAGPVSVEHLSLGDEVYALDLSTGITKCKSVTDISRVEADQIVQLQGQRFDFSLSLNHRVPYSFDSTAFEQYRDAIVSEAISTGIREGKNQRRQPYRFDGDDFVEFLGWFVTEGSVYWSKQRRTASVQIAQKTERYRTKIQSLLQRIGFTV